MDFDDPIGDLLSEGSNDSFFEDPKIKKTTAPSKAGGDIFGLDENPVIKKEQTIKNDDWLGLSPSKERKATTLKTKKSENVSFDTDDVTSLLGTSTEQKRASKKSILDDLLEDKQEDKKASFDDLFRSSIRKKESIITPSNTNIAEAKSQPHAQSEYTPILGRESRRTRRNSPSILDPLGLFESESKGTKSSTLKRDTEIEKPLDGRKSVSQTIIGETLPNISSTKSKSLETLPKNPVSSESNKNTDLPDWLSNGKPKQKPEPETVVQHSESSTQNVTETAQKQFIPDSILDSVLTQQKIASSHLELQNTSLALQQQESQLMIALQLKKYEENLMEMQRKQEDILVKQDIQFNSLLEKQFAKQQMIENNMRLQQERINNHIQLLMSQPTVSISADTLQEKQQKNDYLKNTLEEHKTFYDNIVVSLKQKHQEEIFLLEESYKKQLHFLENTLESTEKRLLTEIDNINKYYNVKLEEINNDKEAIVLKYEEKIKLMQEANKSELEIIKDSYKHTVDDVRNEYKLMLEDLSKQKLKENMITEQSEIFNQKLNENIETLNTNANAINELRSRLSTEHKVLEDMKTESLNAKELEIKMMQSILEKQRIANDNEKAQMLALIKTLETRLVEQTQSAREERWALQQASATLAARSLALDRETEFIKSNLEREREQIKTLKETLLAEQEGMILKLTEEKLALAAEKSRLEISSKLSKNFDNSKAQIEIEAAIKVAREATEMTDRERESLCRQQSELEMLKRNVQDQHKKLLTKEKDLENLLRTAEQKYKDGEKALNEARAIEYKYNEKLKDIQRQLISLADREKKLTEEKILLSKERLSIHNTLKDNKRCSLCEVDYYKSEYDLKKQRNLTEPKTRWNTDVEILRLKYDIQNEMDASKDITIAENDSDD